MGGKAGKGGGRPASPVRAAPALRAPHPSGYDGRAPPLRRHLPGRSPRPPRSSRRGDRLMSNAIANVPVPVNEPVRSHAPGSPERASLKKRLDEMMGTEIEIPIVIGG